MKQILKKLLILATLLLEGLNTLGVAQTEQLQQTSTGKGTLNTEVEMKIIVNGTPKGSLLLPKGREVTILEETEGSLKITSAGLGHAWVAKHEVDLAESKDATQPPQETISTESEVNTTDTANATDATESLPLNQKQERTQKGINPKLEINSSQTEEKIDFEDSGCRGKTITTNLQPVITNLEAEDLENTEIRVFAIINNDNASSMQRLNQKTDKDVSDLKLKRLKPKTGSNEKEFEYKYRVVKPRGEKQYEEDALQAIYAEIRVNDQVVYSNKDELKKKEQELVEEELGRASN